MFKTILFLSLLAGPIAHAQTRVVDGDTLEIDGTSYRLNGIDAPEFGQKCIADDKEWSCGEAALQHLSALIEKREVTCVRISNDAYGRVIATCTTDGQDLGEAMVASGMAWAFTKFSDAYVSAQDKARMETKGIWRGPNMPAWEFRENRWETAKQTAPDGCPIKGNISRNGQIYHAPWSPWYDRTRINPSRGERWFCDEAEALKAGWRAPHWP